MLPDYKKLFPYLNWQNYNAPLGYGREVALFAENMGCKMYLDNYSNVFVALNGTIGIGTQLPTVCMPKDVGELLILANSLKLIVINDICERSEP